MIMNRYIGSNGQEKGETWSEILFGAFLFALSITLVLLSTYLLVYII